MHGYLIFALENTMRFRFKNQEKNYISFGKIRQTELLIVRDKLTSSILIMFTTNTSASFHLQFIVNSLGKKYIDIYISIESI